MGFNIRHIKKYWRWVKKTHIQYKENAFFSKEYARRCLALDIALLRNRPDEEIDRAAMKKHEWVLDYMADKCSETIAKYKNMPAPENLHKLNTETKVWSMWWQGEEHADKLFRMCIDSARRHTGQEVITLSKDNYENYFEIPEYILQKNREGKIALQHICDLMVVSIMRRKADSSQALLCGGLRIREKNF